MNVANNAIHGRLNYLLVSTNTLYRDSQTANRLNLANMKPGFFPSPYPDELLYSLCARYAYRVRYPNSRAINSDLFGSKRVASSIDFPNRLRHFSNSLPSGHSLSTDNLINNHTLLPFYCPFLPPERAKCIRRAMEGSHANKIYNMAGINSSLVRPPGKLCFCPICADEDRKRFGECYWHRLHQVSGVVVCPTHNVLLESSNVPVRYRINDGIYIWAEHAISISAIRPLDLTCNDHRILTNIASDVQWLLSQTEKELSAISLRDSYFKLFTEHGLVTPSYKIRNRRLVQIIKDRSSRELLDILQCQISGQKSYSWPSLLMVNINKNKCDPPIRHLLVIRALGDTIESFFNRSRSAIISTAARGKFPFGRGHWPCLNPECEHFGKLRIEAFEIKNNKRSDLSIEGIFACICGFVYSRKGPDKSPKDNFRYDRVISFGSIWEAALRKLWKDGSISLRQIGNKLGSDARVIKYKAAELGLSFPRKGPSPKIARMPPSTQRAIRKRRLDKTPKAKLKVINSYKKEWLTILRKYPKANRTSLQQHIAPGVYAFLYHHDRQWLLSHIPAPAKKTGPSRQIDWKKRDFELTQKICEVAKQIMSENGPPVRVSRRAIERAIGGITYILTYRKALKKLPLTAKSLDKVCESCVDFTIRRIHYAADCFLHENIIPSMAKLRGRANVDFALWHHPEIEKALRATLVILNQIPQGHNAEAA
jgi:hypothetical protein